MKQARKAGMTLLQRLGTDAHYAFNCAVQDLSPACMHYITVLGNVVLPSIRRTAEEIRTGKVRQFKARMCLVATDDSPVQTIVVDDHVLIWYKNRFYRANQFAAAYALLPIQDRFEILSEANQTFQSLAMSKQDVYADILSYVENILRPLTGAKDTEGGSRPQPHGSAIQTTPGQLVLGMDRIRGPHMVTARKSGTISTTNGLTRSGKIGDVEIKVTNIVTVVGRAIAEAPRRGTSRLVA